MNSDEQYSLEERRKRNIERNQNFLRDLLAANESPSESPSGSPAEGAMFSPKKLCKRTEKSDDVQSIVQQFPCRELQITTLRQALKHRLRKVYSSQTCGQCVILYGPSGCGKFAVLTKLLDLESCCKIVIDCKFIVSFPDLMQSLYIETINKLQMSSIWTTKLKSYRDFNYRCSDVADYISFLQKYLLDDDVSFDTSKESFSIVLVFKHFDHLLAQSKLLTVLPQISQFSAIPIHIIFSLSSLPLNYGDAPYYHQLLHFPAYREEELRVIIKYVFKKECENFLDELINNHDDEHDHSIVFPKDLFLSWMNEEIISSYDRLCDYTIPLVKSYGIHKISHIQKLLYAMWIKLFLQKDAEQMLQDAYAQILQSLSSIATNGSVSTHDDSNVQLKKLQRPNQSQLKVILEELLKKPYETHTTTLPRQSNGNSSSIVKTISSNLAQGSYHAQSIPIEYRRIIIACYIASQNPRQYDELAFMIENKQKRRKPRMPTQSKEKQTGDNNGHEKTGKGDGEGNNKAAELVSTSITDAINTNYRIISLERILSIYSHIVLHTTKRKPGATNTTIEINFANPLLSGFVGQMVKEHLLYPASNWILSAPQYIANISSQYAQEIAKSLDFPLQHFLLHGQSSGYQWVW